MLDMLIREDVSSLRLGWGIGTWGSSASRSSPWPFRAFSQAWRNTSLTLAARLSYLAALRRMLTLSPTYSPVPVRWCPEYPTPDRWSTRWEPFWGGTTTVVDFAPVPKAGDLAQGIHDYLQPWQGNAYTDYSTHCFFTSSNPPDTIARYQELVAAGLNTLASYEEQHGKNPYDRRKHPALPAA